MSDDLVTYNDDGMVVPEAETEETHVEKAPPAAKAAPKAKETQPEPDEKPERQRGADGKFLAVEPEKKPEPKKEEPPKPARLKLRVPKDDGSGEDEVEMDEREVAQRLADARRLSAQHEKERGAREAAEREGKAYRSLVEGLKSGEKPGALLRDFIRESGLSAEAAEDALADALAAELEEQSLTPEQKELRELRAREAKRQDEAKRTEAQKKAAEFEKTVREKAETHAKVWGEALTKTGLPASPGLLADIARHDFTNRKKGLTLTSDELAAHVAGEFDRGLQARLKDVTPESLEKRLPELTKAWRAQVDAMPPADFIKAHPQQARALLKHFREQARAKPGPSVGPTRPAPRAPAKPEGEAPVFYPEWGSR